MFSYDRDNIARADPGPADDAYMITPNDGAVLSMPVRAIRVAMAGTLHITTRSGVDRTLDVIEGEVITCGATKVFSTGTSATGLLGYV